jgi:serine/threonine protein kinase
MQRALIGGRYALGGLLGSGGMAQVYLAHDEVLDRDVALKILRKQYAEDEEFVERFRREARSAARLSHPNIVAVYDQGQTEDGTYYIAMEYVPGETLKDGFGETGPSSQALPRGWRSGSPRPSRWLMRRA